MKKPTIRILLFGILISSCLMHDVQCQAQCHMNDPLPDGKREFSLWLTEFEQNIRQANGCKQIEAAFSEEPNRSASVLCYFSIDVNGELRNLRVSQSESTGSRELGEQIIALIRNSAPHTHPAKVLLSRTIDLKFYYENNELKISGEPTRFFDISLLERLTLKTVQATP